MTDTTNRGNNHRCTPANWSVVFAFLAVLLLASPLWFSFLLPAKWHPPFIPELLWPRYLLASGAITSGLMALAAISTGHLAFAKARRGPASHRPSWTALLAASIAYLALPPVLLAVLGVFSDVAESFIRELGFFSVFIRIAYYAALPAFLLVHTALRFSQSSLRKGPPAQSMGGPTWRPAFGALLGYMSVAVVLLATMSFTSKGLPAADSAACSDNLKRLDQILRWYVEEHNGMYPPLFEEPGVLMFSPEAILPDESVRRALRCPTVRHAKKGTARYEAAHMDLPPFDDHSYYYLGYIVLDDEDMEAFAEAYKEQVARGGTFEEDLVLQTDGGTRVFPRLQGMSRRIWNHIWQRKLGVDSPPTQQQVDQYLSQQEPRGMAAWGPTVGFGGGSDGDYPVLIERCAEHVYTDWDTRPHYTYVLYAHQGLVRVEPGTWPITEKTLGILEELAD